MRKIQRTFYIAADGVEFRSKRDCEEHEEVLRKASISQVAAILFATGRVQAKPVDNHRCDDWFRCGVGDPDMDR